MCPIEDERYLTFPDVNVVERHAFLCQYFASTIDVPYNKTTASRLSFVVLFVPFLLGIMFNDASANEYLVRKYNFLNRNIPYYE